MWKIALALVGLASSSPIDNVDFSTLNTFALRLLDNTYAFQENFGVKNIAISPLSLWSFFSLLAEGSSGQTFVELTNALLLPKDLRATQKLHLGTKNILRSNNRDIILTSNTAMFTDCSLEVHPEFCEAANLYRTEIYSVDARNTTKLAGDINYYICMATQGKILNAVRPSNLENLRMVLIDALYFKANWTHPFDPAKTERETFYNSQGKPIGKVNMMFNKAPYKFGDVPQIGAQVLELTYGKNEEFGMLILLPYDGTHIKKLLNNLATQPLTWLKDFRYEEVTKVECSLPRFVLSSQNDMIKPLQYTGIYSIFDSQRAELPGVSASPLYVTSTVQNVQLEVTEEGTVAAVATVVGLEDRMAGLRFEANKEFAFLIVDRRTDVIIFAGTYGEPSLV